MTKMIDDHLNRITMYRLVLYYLILLLGVAVVFSFTGALAYDPYALLFSIAFLLAVCATTNWIFSKVFGVPTNVESSYISALILALVISPIQSYSDLWFLGWAAILAMASKYILAIKGKHLFNPVAFAVVLTYFTINQSASWWIGDAKMLPFVLLGGVIIIRKIRKFDMVLAFLTSALATLVLMDFFTQNNFFTTIQRTVLYSPIFFFAFIFLTEPLTTPPTRILRLVYGALIGLFFTPLIHFGSFYTTPELALLIGNVFSYIVSPKTKLLLKLKEKRQLSPDTYEFVFAPRRKLAFTPGQYMEWTLGYPDPDSRGNRRYFTLASSPTERELRLGVKFYPSSSAYKKALLSINSQDEIIASQLAGDFVLPKNPNQKCVFIAGGIGITPFRSMIKYLLDIHQRRPIVIFYSNKTFNDILYKDIFDRAERELGIRTIYTLTEKAKLPLNWRGKVGRINSEWIKETIPDYRNAIFYISGPTGMVDSYKDTLHQIGIHNPQIKTDYFLGLT